MNKIVDAQIVGRFDDSFMDYGFGIYEKIEDMESRGLEVEIHYGDNSTMILGRKHEYSAEEL